MVTTTLKHYLYDLALNIFFDAVSNNFHTGVNLIGKTVRLTHIDDNATYTIIVTEVNHPDYAIPNITGTLEDISNDELGSEYNFELDYFNMVLL